MLRKNALIKNRQSIILTIATILANPVLAQRDAGGVRYSPLYFGPNASPVPQFSGAVVPSVTTIGVGGSYFGGFDGDITFNGGASVEIPFVARRLAVKIWTTFLEYYEMPQRVAYFREVEDGVIGGQSDGLTGIGDVYIQTRISVLEERKWLPAVVVNITLKTASVSAEDFHMRRYFDTPGYYFDIEYGKSVYFSNKIVGELRVSGAIGFLCWETTASTQNDALMGGVKVVVRNAWLGVEGSFGGYKGWMANGDHPIVAAGRVMFMPSDAVRWFVDYQRGVRNFPYVHWRCGFEVGLEKITPRYNRGSKQL